MSTGDEKGSLCLPTLREGAGYPASLLSTYTARMVSEAPWAPVTSTPPVSVIFFLALSCFPYCEMMFLFQPSLLK